MKTIHVQPTGRDLHIVGALRRHITGRDGRMATTADVVRYALRVAYRRLLKEEKKRGEIEERAAT